MTDKARQLRNSFTYLLPLVVNGFFPLITLPIFTRILTREDYGVLALVQVYAIFLSGLGNFGMPIAYERNFFQYRNDKVKTGELLYSSLFFVVINFLFLALLTYFFKEPLSRFITNSPGHGTLLFWAFCGQFFIGISFYYLTFFKNSENAKDYVAYTIAMSLMNLCLSLLLVAYYRVGVMGIVQAQVISGSMVFIALTYKFVTSLPVGLNRATFKDSLRIAYPLTPRIFFGILATQFDKYMIGLLASVGGVGVYSIGQKLAYAIFAYMTAIENVFSPQVYRRMFDLKERGGKEIGPYLTPFVYVSLSIALLVALFSEEAIFLMTPAPFHGAIDIVILLSIYYGFMFFGKLTGQQLIFMKKTHITSVLTIVSIGLNIGFNVPFILKWGATGAAWGTLLAGVISVFISFLVAQHYYEIAWEYGKIAAILAIFLGSAALMGLWRFLAIDYEYRAVFKGLSIVAYVCLGVKLKVITMENFTMVKSMLGLKRA